MKYLITGSTGLIGSALVRELLSSDDNIICCPVRNVPKARSMLGDSDRLVIIDTDLLNIKEKIIDNFDFIIHCASPTASLFFVEHPVETIRFGIESTTSILDYAKIHKVKSMVYLSSLEVYGTIIDDSEPLTEEKQGYINPLDIRSSYNIAKKACETICFAYFKEYNIPVKIARLTQTISHNVSINDNRVFAQFGRKAAFNEDIELHTTGESARQYIFIDDAVRAILTILFEGENGEAYNVANDTSYISAKDMAYFVQNNFNPSGKVIFQLKDNMGYAPTTKIRLDVSKLYKLGWKPKYGLYDMYNAMIEKIRESAKYQ